jgi:hypothetical protein
MAGQIRMVTGPRNRPAHRHAASEKLNSKARVFSNPENRYGELTEGTCVPPFHPIFPWTCFTVSIRACTAFPRHQRRVGVQTLVPVQLELETALSH